MKDEAIKESIKTEINGAEKNKLFPTDIGVVVNDFLVENFERVLSYNFTADVEQQFDDIANGDLKWQDMISKFYKPFHENIETTLKDSEKATGERILGIDEASGKEIISRIGRYGPMIQIGRVEDEEKPRFASLRPEQSIQTITLEEAIKLFDLPRTLGTSGEEDIVAAVGRFGPYVRVGKTFVSLPKDVDYDVYDISLAQALELYEAKKIADVNKFIKTFDENPDIQVLNGRFGPYIKAGKKNVKIPKGTEPASLTLEQCLELAAAAPEKKARGKKKK